MSTETTVFRSHSISLANKPYKQTNKLLTTYYQLFFLFFFLFFYFFSFLFLSGTVAWSVIIVTVHRKCSVVTFVLFTGLLTMFTLAINRNIKQHITVNHVSSWHTHHKICLCFRLDTIYIWIPNYSTFHAFTVTAPQHLCTEGKREKKMKHEHCGLT